MPINHQHQLEIFKVIAIKMPKNCLRNNQSYYALVSIDGDIERRMKLL